MTDANLKIRPRGMSIREFNENQAIAESDKITVRILNNRVVFNNNFCGNATVRFLYANLLRGDNLQDILRDWEKYTIKGRILLVNQVCSTVDIDLEMDPLRDWAKK